MKWWKGWFHRVNSWLFPVRKRLDQLSHPWVVCPGIQWPRLGVSLTVPWRGDGPSLCQILFSTAKQPRTRSCLGVHRGLPKDKLHTPQEKCCLFHIGNSLKPYILGHSNFAGSSTPEEMSPFGHCESVIKSSINFHWEKFISYFTQGQLYVPCNNTNCYRLNTCVPPKFICWNPNSQGGGIWRWGL